MEKLPQWRFFNGTGSFNREWCYREHEYRILKDNSDAFGSLNPTPLIPTLMPMVYVNKFPADNKTVYTVYNSKKVDISGDILAVETIKGYHFVDLYNYSQVRTIEKDGKTIVPIKLAARSVTCIAHLPRIAEVKVGEDKVNVRLSELTDQGLCRVVAADGRIISEIPLTRRHFSIDRPQNADIEKGVLFKLYKDKRLVDAESIGKRD